MVDIEKVKAGLKAHGGPYGCNKCPYLSDVWCEYNIADDALTVIEDQEKHINELHEGIVKMRDAMKGELKHDA